MLNRNIKQSITALEVFTRLEDKIQTGECKINDIFTYAIGSLSNTNENININIKLLNDSTLYLRIDDKVLYIVPSGICPKVYKQELTDEEFEDVKKRFIKLAQKQQDDFEQWIKSPDVILN
jgi:hypothetical protein